MNRVTCAPISEPMPAARQVRIMNRTGSVTRRQNAMLAFIVPVIAASLLVPNNWGGDWAGRMANNAGNCTSPPPPTVASTKPAKNALRVNRKKLIKKEIEHSAAQCAKTEGRVVYLTNHIRML
jgi:hypothetical protein